MNKRIIAFLVGRALTDTGGTFSQVAVFWTALSITGSAISVGSLGGMWTFSMAVMNLISGTITDRFNRKALMILLDGLLGVVSLALFALTTTGVLRIWHLWFFLIAEAVLGTPSALAFRTMLPDLVNKNVLLRVNGAMHSWGGIDNLVEAAAAGVIIKLWGPGPIFLINAITYFLGAVSPLFIWRLASRAHNDSKRWHPFSDLRFTTKYLSKERLMRKYIFLNLGSGVVFAPLFFMAPLVAKAIGAGSVEYGLFQSLTIGGLLAGSLIATTIGGPWPKVVVWLGGAALYSLGFAALGFWLCLPMALSVFFLFGLGWTGGRVYMGTLVQQMLPSNHRGRIMGITSFLSGVLQPLSLSLATVFVEHIGLGTVLIVVGLVNLAIASLCALILPLRERDWKLSVPGDE
jgi:MFS family permease